jgi:hypothetical protein
VRRLDIPTPGLLPFFENFFEHFGRVHVKFGLVLIIDQFEELFTRFVDVGRVASIADKESNDWRLRSQFIDELRQLYASQKLPSDGVGAKVTGQENGGENPLRMRHVLSMRDGLDASRSSFFHLDFLGLDEAASAINEPAAFYGYSYSSECFQEIANDLVREARYIEPAHIQIVCERLWMEFAADRGASTSHDASSPFQITSEMLGGLGGARGILSSYFSDFLARFNKIEQFSILEMLEPLITSRGTRNIVEKAQLTQLAFRSLKLTEKLLEKVEASRIVRVEPRLGGSFVEITHEFLIPSILAAIREYLITDIEISAFREAVRSLRRLQELGFGRADDPELSARYFLRLHARRRYLTWSGYASEWMFRASILHGMKRGILRYWGRAFSKLSEDVTAELLIDRLSSVSWRGGMFDQPEVRAILAKVDFSALSVQAKERLLVSALTGARPFDPDTLVKLLSSWEQQV